MSQHSQNMLTSRTGLNEDQWKCNLRGECLLKKATCLQKWLFQMLCVVLQLDGCWHIHMMQTILHFWHKTSSQAPSYASPKLWLTYSLTGVRWIATSVVKNIKQIFILLSLDKSRLIKIIVFYNEALAGLRPAGLDWIVGRWPVWELWKSHASLRACGAQLERGPDPTSVLITLLITGCQEWPSD